MSLIDIYLFIFKRFYLFIHERHREKERGRDTGRGRSRLHAGSPMWDSILGLQDHTLGWRQVLNRWATQGSLISSLCDGSLRISSNPVVSSLPLKISIERFELGRNGRHWTCCTALNSICNFSGTNRPWMFLSVENFILSWLSWKFFSDNSRGWSGKSSFFTQGRPFQRRSCYSKGPLLKVQ